MPVDRLELSSARKDELQTVRITSARLCRTVWKSSEGSWWAAESTRPQLAISERAQRDFHLRLGDRVVFQIAGRKVEAPVVAVFQREQRAPVRFELVFPLRALEGMPVVYYGAAHVDPPRIPAVEEAIFENFPTVTVMNLADILTRIQEAVDQVALGSAVSGAVCDRRGRDHLVLKRCGDAVPAHS